MSKYHKLLLPALVVGASLLVPAATAEAKVIVNGDEGKGMKLSRRLLLQLVLLRLLSPLPRMRLATSPSQ